MVSHSSQESLSIVQENGTQKLHTGLAIFLQIFLVLALGTIAVVVFPSIAIGGFVLLIIFALSFKNIEYALLLALLMRPFLDFEFVRQYIIRFPGISVELDAAGALNIFIALIGILYILVYKINFLKSSVSRTALMFIAICASTIIVSSDRVLSLAQVTILISQFIIYIIFANVIKTRKQVNKLIAIYLLIAIVPGITAIFQVLSTTLSFRGTGVPRVDGGFTTNAALGDFMVLPLTIAVIVFLQSSSIFKLRKYPWQNGNFDFTLSMRPKSLLKRIGFAALLALFLIPFFYSQTRVAWAGFLLIVFILVAFKYKKLLLLLPVILTILWVTIPAISLRFSDLDFHDPETSTLGVRYKLWSAASELFKSSPITGIGFGVSDIRTGVLAIGRPYAVHNTYLRVLADTGLVGFIFYVLLLFCFLKDAVSSYKKVTDPFHQALVIGFIGIWASLMWQQFWGNHITTNVRQFYFWSYAGLIYALPRVEQQNTSYGNHHTEENV